MGSQGSHVLFGFSLVQWTERIIANHVYCGFSFAFFSSAAYCGFLCFHIPEFDSFVAFFYRG